MSPELVAAIISTICILLFVAIQGYRYTKRNERGASLESKRDEIKFHPHYSNAMRTLRGATPNPKAK